MLFTYYACSLLLNCFSCTRFFSYKKFWNIMFITMNSWWWLLIIFRFVDNGSFPEQFQYKAKSMFVFEEIDGTDVCFFGMHVQEYGSECQHPNTRYIAYFIQGWLFGLIKELILVQLFLSSMQDSWICYDYFYLLLMLRIFLSSSLFIYFLISDVCTSHILTVYISFNHDNCALQYIMKFS